VEGRRVANDVVYTGDLLLKISEASKAASQVVARESLKLDPVELADDYLRRAEEYAIMRAMIAIERTAGVSGPLLIPDRKQKGYQGATVV
jgi:hypothetical protein